LCFNNHDIVEKVAVPEWDAGGLESVSQTFAPPLDVDGKKTPSKNLYQVLRGGSSYSRFSMISFQEL